MSADLPPIGSIISQLAIVTALVVANGFFVASEFALVSVRRTRIDQLAAEGNHNALAVQRAVADISRYIAATQVGVTVASLLLGGLGEKILEPLLLPVFGGMPSAIFGITRAGFATGLAYFVMTTMHVVIGELLPKSVALHKAEKLALFLVWPMSVFVRAVTPIVWFLNMLGNALLKICGLHAAGGHEQVHSPEELDMLFSQSHDAGEINKTEFEILHRVVKFSDLTVREIMVPRVEMTALPATLTRPQLESFLMGKPHTRVPVYSGSFDDIVGIVHLKDLVRLFSTSQDGDEGQPLNLSGTVREAPRVPETITIDRLLVDFQHRRQQMAIVIDEFGGTSGIVTMGDLLEQAFGDVHDEFDRPEPEIVQVSPNLVRLSGRLLIEAVNEKFGTGFPVDEADTVAGLIMDVLGRVAAEGDQVTVGNTQLCVESVERQRIVWVTMRLGVEAESDL